MEQLITKTFEEVLESNKEKIYRLCSIYAVSPLEPQDLFQDVVYQIWKSFSTFEGKSNINTWIYKIALNVCYSSKKRLDKREGKKIRLETIQFHKSEVTQDQDLEEKYKALQSCIVALDEKDRVLVILHLEELRYKEIADIMSLTENYVAVRMKRIRKRLLDCITPKLKK